VPCLERLPGTRRTGCQVDVNNSRDRGIGFHRVTLRALLAVAVEEAVRLVVLAAALHEA
jgi:hypothetical protein